MKRLGGDEQDAESVEVGQRNGVAHGVRGRERRNGHLLDGPRVELLEQDGVAEAAWQQARDLAEGDHGATRADAGPEPVGLILQRLGYFEIADTELANGDVDGRRPKTASSLPLRVETPRSLACAERQLARAERLGTRRRGRGTP